MGSYPRGASGNGECVHFCILIFENQIKGAVLMMWIFARASVMM